MSRLITMESPSGSMAVVLRQLGEIHFGPAYYSAEAVGFFLDLPPGTIVGGARWSPDGNALVLTILHETGASRAPDCELVTVSPSSGQVRTVARGSRLIEIVDVDDISVVTWIGADQRVLPLAP